MGILQVFLFEHNSLDFKFLNPNTTLRKFRLSFLPCNMFLKLYREYMYWKSGREFILKNHYIC